MGMPARLVLASAFTLFALFALLGTLVALALYLLGAIDIWLVIVITILANVVAFFLAPPIQDWILRTIYGAKFYTVEEFRAVAPEISDLVEAVSEEHGFAPPRLALIPDMNPTAFTYGSTRSRSRIVLTRGILEYLDPDEREAVVAHELGHIVHYDFAIMAFATLLLQIMYEIYVWSREAARASERRRSREKGGNSLAILAAVAFVFYVVGRYILLYLSRVREYYADDFAARRTSPRSLASALLKVAYGIVRVPDDRRARRLLRSTETLGIVGEKAAKEGALLLEYLRNKPDRLGRLVAWDFYSPWAFLAELSSTHPLTGKRIVRLLKMAGERLDIPRPNMGRLYGQFVRDLFVYISPPLLPVAGAVATVIQTGCVFAAVPAAALFFAAALFLRALYAYPRGEPEDSTLLELLEDPYASPVRGRRVALRGRVVGRGVPGYVLGEDIALEDSTGIVYVNYESWFPVLGNLFFALRKVRQLLGREVTATGWYFRHVTPRLDLEVLEDGVRVRSYPYMNLVAVGIVFLLLGLAAAGVAFGDYGPCVTPARYVGGTFHGV